MVNLLILFCSFVVVMYFLLLLLLLLCIFVVVVDWLPFILLSVDKCFNSTRPIEHKESQSGRPSDLRKNKIPLIGSEEVILPSTGSTDKTSPIQEARVFVDGHNFQQQPQQKLSKSLFYQTKTKSKKEDAYSKKKKCFSLAQISE